ncbi:MAG: hypothetical protein NZM15_02345 [Flavobacteriales bacterium]|nr:hypothetical protein [Flavobacteriales bacterium]MDW8431526.1 hypothetical protein [Flavobacteriales bacterium]
MSRWHHCILFLMAFVWVSSTAQENAPPPRVMFNVDVGPPFMLSNSLQRQFLRGLILVNPSLSFRIGRRMYPGLDLYYGVWQSVNPYNFKDANRDVVMHHAGGGLSLGYLFKTPSRQVDVFARLVGGFTEIIFSGVAKGVDTSVFVNPENRRFLNSFFVGPSLTVFLYLDEDQKGAAGFHLGSRFLPYRLSREDLYLNKESSYSGTPDAGPSLFLNFGISFTYKFGKRRAAVTGEP